MLALLSKWGLQGFYEHTERVAAFYKDKRDMFERAAHKHLDGLATWVSSSVPGRLRSLLTLFDLQQVTPDSGMFVRWFSSVFLHVFRTNERVSHSCTST